MSVAQSKAERLLTFYDNVRTREEIERRRLRFTPIDWNF
jgi:hypothetical protein